MNSIAAWISRSHACPLRSNHGGGSIHLHTELEDILALGEAILACANK